MKHLITSVLLLAAVAFVSQTARADVYASGIRFVNPDGSAYDGNPADGTPVMIRYMLNDTANSVTIRIHNVSGDAVVHTIMQNNLSAGWHAATWDGTGSGGTGEFYVTIEASQSPYSSSAYTVFTFIPTSSTAYTIYSRGVDVIRNQENPYYGYFYTANAGGGPMPQGLCFYTSDGWFAGTDSSSPSLTPTHSQTDGGVTPWSASVFAPVFATTDDDGRAYVSDFPAGIVYRIDGPKSTPKAIMTGLTEPKGLAARGSGAGLVLYIASGNQVLRANIGTDDTLMTSLEVIATLDNQVHDVALDDQGFLYVNLREGTGFDGSGVGRTEQYDISGTLPVTSANKVWTITWPGNPIGISLWSGADTVSATDDIAYVSVRGDGVDATAPGIHKITGLHDAFNLAYSSIFKPDDLPESGGGNVSSRADVTVDPVGNVIFWENGNEEIIMLSPPSSGFTVTQTTRSSGTITTGATSVTREDLVPTGFTLAQNFPNPFNPTTNITFELDSEGQTSLRVFDMLGREVATLVNRDLVAGSYQFAFDGRGLESGTYVSVLQHDGKVQSRKMMLVK